MLYSKLGSYYSMDDAIDIHSGDDLDNYTECGNYLSIGANITVTLLNCPLQGTGFVLHIERTTGGAINTWCRQCIVPNQRIPVEFWRTMHDGVWSKWVKVDGESLTI